MGIMAQGTAGETRVDSLPRPILNQALARLRSLFEPGGGDFPIQSWAPMVGTAGEGRFRVAP
jgi:hypothetical protein